MPAEPLAARIASRADRQVDEEHAGVDPVIGGSLAFGGRACGDLCHARPDVAAIEDHAVAVDAHGGQFFHTQNHRLHQMTVVINGAEAVRALRRDIHQPVAVWQPGEVSQQRFLRAGHGHHEQVVIGPLVGRVVTLCHRSHRDDPQYARVVSQIGHQRVGETAKFIDVHVCAPV